MPSCEPRAARVPARHCGTCKEAVMTFGHYLGLISLARLHPPAHGCVMNVKMSQ